MTSYCTKNREELPEDGIVTKIRASGKRIYTDSVLVFEWRSKRRGITTSIGGLCSTRSLQNSSVREWDCRQGLNIWRNPFFIIFV